MLNEGGGPGGFGEHSALGAMLAMSALLTREHTKDRVLRLLSAGGAVEIMLLSTSRSGGCVQNAIRPHGGAVRHVSAFSHPIFSSLISLY